MKFVHLSDLHIGKRVHEYSLIEDQRYILTKIINIIDEIKAQGVIIAGDIYDKPVPPAEAVQLFDDFLYRLSKRNLQVFIISGNHDSAERIAFASRLIEQSGVHLSPVYNGEVTPVTLTDEHGEIDIYMLPFIKPQHVRKLFEEETISSYTDAIRVAVENMNIDTDKRNILITHQFVTGSTRCDSEDVSVGGTDNVDGSVFSDFDYVALGHIHSPQNCGSEKIRYCGTPLKYSFSEAKHQKSVTVVDFLEKGNMEISTIPLVPLRDLKEIKGKYEEIMSRDFYSDTTYQDDYMSIILTDEEEVYNALSNLRVVYKNLMKIEYDNKRTRQNNAVIEAVNVEKESPLKLFSDFYELQNNQALSDEQTEFMENLIEKIWEEQL